MKRALEIRKFHVAVIQPWQINEQNGMMHVKICCFVNKNLLPFCCSPSVAVVFGFVVIQKSHFSSLLTIFTVQNYGDRILQILTTRYNLEFHFET